MKRRSFLTTALAALATPALAGKAGVTYEVTRSEEEWRAMLTELEYSVMREEGTERPYTSPLNDENRTGTFLCKGCDQPLYASETKYDSGTGWPSFYQAKSGAIGTKDDRKLLSVRTECHCSRCGSHLGHIFDDGPEPTGKRHCINGVSLTFAPA
ncbi:peptide-methionine (R)-S-oxide reductase MsrB [Maritimibacter sp. UBA3975]|uniref:peptide-methionine (R)-S-oxide reductase MsrB n=1 Tax=Maritimibacter sp. UBA3975 TaxID=1946833 RepID=UPI000C0A10A0|nr:peptide-methionine (R)-S-oxide reductase MsrB [Maritimibacter sp. UBA3975]MAM61647.1 peptide-methionine (R)-S-oxide reductase [Maritimibacter sp.]|tara:strand:- start:8089 stop:8553 length:465 start_codon:yes stop_codon:yes gene_type:complete